MLARRIGSATATTTSTASASIQPAAPWHRRSRVGQPARCAPADVPAAAGRSAESSASLVARGVLTRPEYTAWVSGLGFWGRRLIPRNLKPRTRNLVSGCAGRGGAVGPARRDEPALGRQLLGHLVL